MIEYINPIPTSDPDDADYKAFLLGSICLLI